MKGLILAVLLTALTFTGPKAQLRVAILGGIHSSDVLEDNDLPDFTTFKDRYQPRTGAHFGFLADMRFSPTSRFWFQPGVIFQNRGRKSFFSQDSTVVFVRPGLPDSSTSTIYIENGRHFINYIDIPLNIVFKLPLGKKAKFILGGGPYVSFFYNGFSKVERNTVGVEFINEENNDLPVGKEPGQYAILNYGANALAGFEIGRVFLTANYARGLNDFYKPAGYTGSFKHEQFGGTLGIFLGKPVEQVKDNDRDGVPDETDQCPTEKGTAATFGCPDKDGDGIADRDDSCPDIAGPAITKGCPDTDGDGIADKDDSCPGKPGVLALKGCPDRDGDGIADDKDQCPDTPGLARYNGCPATDRDKDGVNDEDDKCPDVPGAGRYAGCPVPDTDGDGVNDEEDKCPTEKGIPERNGCPEVKKEVIEKITYAAKRIQFRFAKAELTTASYRVLDEVVAILEANAGTKLTIEGHTSTDGTREANMKLSQQRADNVKAYLVSKGVDASRIATEGFGPDRPLNNDKTEAQKALNRRVELRLE